MSPSDVGFVFLIGVLRVENQNIAAAQEIEPSWRAAPPQFLRLFRTQLISLRLNGEKTHTARDQAEKQLSRRW